MLEIHAASRVMKPSGKVIPLARSSSVRTKPTARAGFGFGVGVGVAAFAAAAVLLLFFGFGREKGDVASSPISSAKSTMKVSAPRAAAPVPLVVCPDGEGQNKCVEDAHRHGLVVSYPPWAAAPPLGGGRPGQGPNGSPFAPNHM